MKKEHKENFLVAFWVYQYGNRCSWRSVIYPFTFPFLLLALFGFAKSSAKMENWFRSTGLYRKHLEPLMEKKTMTRRAKITVMLSMTLFMGIGFWFMDSVPVGRVILALVWLFHMIYFTKGIRTAAAGEV